MKVQKVQIQNFKRFKDLTIEVKNAELNEVADQFLILGDNGTGKTTVLQAIASCLWHASGEARSVESFDWPGWVPGRYARWGQPHIELDVFFSDDEIKATQEAARCWNEVKVEDKDNFFEPPHCNVVKVELDGDRSFITPREAEPLLQARAYTAFMLKTDPGVAPLFDRLPGVFWFDQFRTLATPSKVQGNGSEHNGTEEETFGSRISYDVGVGRLRDYLNRWKLAKLARGPQSGQRDFLLDLENLYKKVFPGRSFSDPEPMFRGGVPSPSDYYFTISDGARTYDIEEMSAGEQSVFPMLFEFVRQQIKNSVVLIDEIDLNLHPPLAQTLLSILPQLGPNCQFIFTTHSEAISNLVSPEQVHRLKGGRLCL